MYKHYGWFTSVSKKKVKASTSLMHEYDLQRDKQSQLTIAFATFKRMSKTKYLVLLFIMELYTYSKPFQKDLVEDNNCQIFTNGDRFYWE